MNGFNRSIAIILGINEYEHGIPKLHTAVKDARGLGRILKKKHGYDVVFRSDREVTLSGLKRLLEEELPLMTHPDDRVLFYFAGHGVATDSDDGPAGYILPQDARPENGATFLQMTDLHKSLSTLKCRHLMVILDCCFAGAFRWSSVRHFRPPAKVIHREQYDYFIKDPAWQVIASSAYDQTALDGSKHSPFASALLRGLLGAADVFPPSEHQGDSGDGVITATELYLYLRWAVEGSPVASESAHRQTPSLWPFGSKHGKGEYIFLVPKRTPQLPPAPPLNEENNPYRGLMPYDEQHKDLFFGREKVKSLLYRQVMSHPMTVVVGASGTGKSSLVKAGLLPRLREQSEIRWQVVSPLRPGKNPMQALVTLLSTEGEPTAPYCSAEAEQASRVLADTVGAWRDKNPDAKLLLVVDQLEELVTMCRDKEEREQFLRALAECLDKHADRFHLVITLRSDFEPQFSTSPLKLLWGKSRFIIPPMTQDELREAIEGPASARVLYFESQELVNQLINEVVQMPGALPLLSFTLSEMYFKYLERRSPDRALTEEDYNAVGGVAGSLRRRANKEYEALRETALQETMRKAMLRMVSLEGGEIARRRMPLSELTYDDVNENQRVALVVNRLTTARLTVKDVDGEGVEYIEPAHDALVRGWDRLWHWIQDEQQEQDNLLLQRRLTEAANDWNKGERQAGQLWDDDPRLPQLTSMLEGRQYWFSSLERGFIKNSNEQRARRRRKRNTWVTAAFVILAVATIVAVYQAVQASIARDKAVEATKEADLQRDIARDESDKAKKALAAQEEAVKQREKERDRAERARDRAVTAEETAKREQARAEEQTLIAREQTFIAQEQTRKAQSELARSLYTQSQVESEERGDLSKALVLASSASEAAPRTDDRLDIYKWRALQLSASAPLSVMPLPTGLLYLSVLSSTRERLFTLHNDGQMEVWNLSNGESYPVPKELYDLGNELKTSVIRVAFSPDNRLAALIAATPKYELFVWRTDSGQQILRVPLPQTSSAHPLYVMSFSPDGKSLVVEGYTPKHTLRVWNVEAPAPPAVPKSLSTNIESILPLSRNPQRNWIVAGSLNNKTKEYEARVVNLATGLSPCAADCSMRHAGKITFAAFSVDAQWLATVSHDEAQKKYALRLWNAETGREAGRYALLSDKKIEVADISRDGTKVLTNSDDGIQVWSPMEMSESETLAASGLKPMKARHVTFSPDESSVAAVIITKQPPNDPGLQEIKTKYEIDVWNLKTLAQTERTERVLNDTFVEVSYDRAIMSAVSNSGKVISWNLIKNNQPASVSLPLAKNLEASIISPDRTLLLTVTHEEGEDEDTVEKLQLWNVASGQPVWENPEVLPSGKIVDGSFSLNSERLMVVIYDNENEPDKSLIYVWNLKDRTPASIITVEGFGTAKFRESTGQIVAITTHEDSTGREYKLLQRCDIETKRCVADEGRKFESILFNLSMDGEHFFLFMDQKMVVGSVAEGASGDIPIPYGSFIDFDSFRRNRLPKVVALFGSLFPNIRGIQKAGASGFSFFIGPPGKGLGSKMTVNISDTTFSFRNDTTGLRFTFPKEFDDHTPPVAFSPDGKWIATKQNNSDQVMRVWEAATGLPVSEGIWHNRSIKNMGFSLDGKHLMTVTEDGIVRWWTFAPAGAERFDWLKGIGEALTAIQFTADGFEYVGPAEYLRLRNSFMEKLRAAAMTDERACLILRQYEPTPCVTQHPER